jgi:hypothetical protein
MNLPVIFGILALIFVWYNLYVSVQIVNYLREKHYDVSLFNGGIYVRGKIFKYLPLYKVLPVICRHSVVFYFGNSNTSLEFLVLNM